VERIIGPIESSNRERREDRGDGEGRTLL